MRRIALVLAALLLAGCGTPIGTPEHPLVVSPAPTTATPSTLIGRLNPDVTQATIGSTICVAGWTARIRPNASYTSKLERQQLPVGADPEAYEEDHLMPLALGGAPKDPANLMPIPMERAKADDVWETRLHRQVCKGTLTLYAAQVKISEIKRGGY